MEFSERFKERCEALKKDGKFYDSTLRWKVSEKMLELGESASIDCLMMDDFIEGDDCPDLETYWLGIHCLACWIGLETMGEV